MDQLSAMRDTLTQARGRGYASQAHREEASFKHLSYMLGKATMEPENFSETKLGQWLGYMQGVLVANGCLTLEECKEINERYSDDWTHHHTKRGTKYKVVGQVRAQCSIMPINDGDMLMLFIGEDGVYSARHPSEFNDGRFERITRPESPPHDKME